MKRRSFIKTLAVAATAVMIPLHLTEFGVGVHVAFEPVVSLIPLSSMMDIPLDMLDAMLHREALRQTVSEMERFLASLGLLSSPTAQT